MRFNITHTNKNNGKEKYIELLSEFKQYMKANK